MQGKDIIDYTDKTLFEEDEHSSLLEEKEYYTPELFLSHSMDHHYITVKSSNIEGEVQDKELKIKDYILEVGSFESIKKNETKSSRFITYHILISNATTGPNYSNMIIYDDGFIIVIFTLPHNVTILTP